MSHLRRTVGIYTLGCKVNQYESEAIAEGLASRGFSVIPFTEFCDAYIINTCTVTAESDRKARQLIRRAIKNNPAAFVLVTGCMAEVFSDKVSKIAGVDYICGTGHKLQVIDALEKVAELFPWRVPGKSDTYDSYNEAWNDAIGRAEMEIEKLPSVHPEPISDVYMKAVWTWLLDYQIKAAELKGRYTPYEVLSWVANDWRKEHERSD